MALRKKPVDGVDVANGLASSALSAFQVAIEDLKIANDILEEERAAATAAADLLDIRAGECASAISKNERVIGKISDLLA